jgi:crotonobetainyl-CoA:carnitine CoA-transferase CaiB-like acyl-CoA transferase
MSLLSGFRVAQLGQGLAAAVCGRLLADLGANVACTDPDISAPLAVYLNDGKTVLADGAAQAALSHADMIVCEGGPAALRERHHGSDDLRPINPSAALVFISPFGQTGPLADQPATDLTLHYASGIARLLIGQVDDLTEPPIRAVGQQSAFIGGIAAACAGMHAALSVTAGTLIDVSIQEALATLAMTELARAGHGGKSRARKRVTDGNGATVCILPARDGYAAISPREDRQWAAWLAAMGSPAWGADPRFASKADRVANWDALHALMSAWSRQYDKQTIAAIAQAAHVPSFPLREPSEQLASAQLAHRGFYRPLRLGGHAVQAPGPPFGLRIMQAAREKVDGEHETLGSEREAPEVKRDGPGGKRDAPGPMPLTGIRVLDFSWVIAGPTTTRYLAAMGAEVIKVEAPGRGDPGRATELHSVLGQAKRSIVLDLKQPEAVEVARKLAARCDVLVENFATGVMERLGLGADALQAINPGLLYVSASGLGRTGPESHAVAYGTLLQCYAGFAGLNRHPHLPPRVGLAWLDPMCGLMLGFIIATAIWHRRRSGATVRVDFSMLEAMLWTMAEPLLAAQLDAPPKPRGNQSDRCAPHGAYRCDGDDDWVSIVVRDDEDWHRLCAIVPSLSEMAKLGFADRCAGGDTIDAALSAWVRPRDARGTADALMRAGLPAAALATSRDLVESPHLRARGFWDADVAGVLPGLPWRASFGRTTGAAPGHGTDTGTVLTEVLALSPAEIAALRGVGALG